MSASSATSAAAAAAHHRHLAAVAAVHHAAAASAAAAGAADSTSPVPSSPLLSPRTWSHSWPTPAWQCFVKGTAVKFVIPSLETPWQTAEELGWKDHIAMKVDSKNTYQYAPNGLAIVKVRLVESTYGSR